MMGNEDQITEGLLMCTVNVHTEVFWKSVRCFKLSVRWHGVGCPCRHGSTDLLFFTQNGEKYLFNKFLKCIFVKKLYIFRAVPLPIIRSIPLYIRHWYMSCRFDGSFPAWEVRLESHHQNCMTYTSAECSRKLLMMGRGTA